MARAKSTKPESVPASAVAPVVSPDQQPRAQGRYQLSLRDNPTMVIEAGNPEDARAAYLAACGILATENPITCDPLPS